MAKMETLRDDFGSGTLDTGKWTNAIGASIDTGRLKLSRASGNAGLEATTTYDITGSSVAYKLTLDSGILTEQWHSVYMPFGTAASDPDINGVGFQFSTDSFGAYLACRFVKDNTFQPNVSLTYDPVAHAWLRVRESAGVLYWETSPDGLLWTIRRSEVHTLSSAILLPTFTASFGVGGTSTKLIYIDNFNVLPNPAAFLPFFI